MKHGFIRVAAATPTVTVADCQAAAVRDMLGLLLAGTARKEIEKRRFRVGLGIMIPGREPQSFPIRLIAAQPEGKILVAAEFEPFIPECLLCNRVVQRFLRRKYMTERKIRAVVH